MPGHRDNRYQTLFYKYFFFSLWKAQTGAADVTRRKDGGESLQRQGQIKCMRQRESAGIFSSSSFPGQTSK